jgi:hypothetical protein
MEKVICVWLGNATSKETLFRDYLAFKYDEDENASSQFGSETGLDYYDEDFMESWWDDNLDLSFIDSRKNGLLDAKHFNQELIEHLKDIDFTKFNFISFLYGEKSNNAKLFNYKSERIKSTHLKLVFKKAYSQKCS